MSSTEIHAVTGAFGYSGKYIARRLLQAGKTVRTPANSPDRTGEFQAGMRVWQWTFILFFLIACWFGMQALHEFGHVLAAWCSGATVERVVLLPISRTDTTGVEHPLFVHGAGSVFGGAFPVLLWLVVRMLRLKMAFLLRFFAGFCLIANGAYIGADFSTVGPTDAGLLVEHGANRVALVLFGLVFVSSGLFLWHGQSRFFFPKRMMS